MRMVPVVFDCRELRLPDGELVLMMVPQKRYAKIATRQFIIGEEYPLVVLEARSRASHGHYFAAIKDGFDNLPEDLKKLGEQLGIKTFPPGGFLNTEHLRKWCLCETGWCDVGEFPFETEIEARRLAKFYRSRDDYCQITLRGTHVTIKVAKSQSTAAMTKQPFEESKKAVLDLIASMVGVTRRELERQAGKSA